jgi:hypothetical protein
VTRIKFTGYIDVEELDPGQYDPSHPSGLTSAGYNELIGLSLSDLEDVNSEVES